MSTALDIVRRALRSMGVLSAGQEPSGSKLSDGVERLQSTVLSLPGLLHNGRWTEVAVDDDYDAEEGDRCTVTSPGTVTLPTTITDCDGTSRPPKDLSRIQIIGADADNAGLWIYSATKGAWGQADAITDGTTEIPFGTEDDAGLAAILAIDIVDEYGGEVSARTIATAQMATRSFRGRFKKAEPADPTRPGGYAYQDADYI